MVYVVSGNPRSGTSLMMHILKTIGIEPFYSVEREENLLKRKHINYLNPYFYEDTEIMSGRIPSIDKIDGRAVKIFGSGLDYCSLLNRENSKVIFMHRYRDPIQTPKRKMKHVSSKSENLCYFTYYIKLVKMVDLIYKFNCLVVDYDRLIDNPVENLLRLKEYLEVDFDPEEVSKVIEPNRRHTVRPTPKEIIKRIRHLSREAGFRRKRKE